jgi:putative endonuclease
MCYVYILRSLQFPKQMYVGSTSDLRRRLAEHNAGKSIHTNKFKPWELAAYIAVSENRVAEQLEKYLKSGSGRAFANRHLLSPTTDREAHLSE